MSTKEARARANYKYRKENCDQIGMTFPGGTRDKWRAYATKQGKSLQAFVREAVEEKAERDGLVEVVTDESDTEK